MRMNAPSVSAGQGVREGPQGRDSWLERAAEGIRERSSWGWVGKGRGSARDLKAGSARVSQGRRSWSGERAARDGRTGQHWEREERRCGWGQLAGKRMETYDTRYARER
jgi:hypothetical protein